MSELIKREDAVIALCELCNKRFENFVPCNEDVGEECRYKKRFLDIPFVDAVPVVHGHWVDMENKHHPQSPVIAYGKGYGMCSHCETVEWLFKNKPFCPYCSAKMDEEVNE